MKIDYITDNHIHIDPINGIGVEAVKQFKRAGGSSMMLVNKTSRDHGITIKKGEDFKAVFNGTIKLGKTIEEELGIRVFVALGVHPGEFVKLCQDFGTKKAREITLMAMKFAGQLFEEGEITCLGEIGRPHFWVEKEILDASNSILTKIMELAKDLGATLQLHSESETKELYTELSIKAKNIGLPPKNLIKHFSGPELIDEAQKTGIMPSIISSLDNVKEGLKHGNRFLMETDYIDDRKRPGAVLGPKTVPRVTKRLIEEGLLSIEDAIRIHKDNFEKTYSVEL